jgi:hypothetical protein
MDERFQTEVAGLKRSWMRHDRDTLREYLVRDVEDPRINVQSILTRHFLIQALFGERFSAVMQQELRFALLMNWLLKRRKAPATSRQLDGVLDALLQGNKQVAGLDIPQFLFETFAGPANADYLCDVLSWAAAETAGGPIPQYLMNTFQAIWRQLLGRERSERISVLEPACGSANDYRFIDSYGIASLLDYTGFDLCEKNIRNAEQMFPEIPFEVGNILDIDAPDKVVDCCFIHDLFEHLSIEAMELAVAEVCRVTRRGICIGFFNMHDGDEHIVKRVNDYHWNKLSLARAKALFERQGAFVDAIHIDAFLSSRFGYRAYHNRGAYTFIVRI